MVESDTLPPSKAQAGMEEVETLVQWRDAAEEATMDARGLAEKDRDYYDNKQLTASEMATLKKRGQPVVIKNRIKRKVDFLCGLEKRQRGNPKAMPRTPVEEQGAFAATDGIKYVLDDQDYAAKRSQAWRNKIVEGSAGFSVGVELKQYGPCITITRCAWDRLFYDPHSSEADFSDAMYLGVDTWMDETDAREQYKENPNLEEILSASYQSAPKQGDTYDDKPKAGVWADRRRKRIRISKMYFRPHGAWYYAEFTKGGLLKGGISPYLNEDSEPDCEFIFQSAYVDRDNNRYGVVREMIGPQDEVNKRSSKALHLFTMRQARIDPRAGLDPQKLQKSLARPDGVVEAAKDEFEILPTGDMATGHFQLLQEAKLEIDLMGANSALLGEQGGAPSGKAIQLNQTGGLIEMGDLMDGLRHLDRRVFRAVWNRIRQFWNEEKWIRVTDDERNTRFVGLNVAQETLGRLHVQFPNGLPPNYQIMQRPVSELDVDIVVDAVPDSIMPEQEQFQGMVELLKAGVQLPPQLLVESIPNLRNRDKIVEMMEQQAQQPNPEVAKAQAELELKSREMEMDAANQQQKASLDAQIAQEKAQQDMAIKAMLAQADIQLEREKANAHLGIENMKAQNQMRIQAASAAAKAKIDATRAKQKPQAA